MRYVRCKKHIRSRSIDSKRWTHLLRPPRSSKAHEQGCPLIMSCREPQLTLIKKSIDTPLWYALCTTHGREEKEYDYLTSKNIVASCPTFKKIKIVDGNSIAINKTRIPNIFFAFATEEELKTFVYDNVNQPYLRFYYRHIIRTADYYDIAASASPWR